MVSELEFEESGYSGLMAYAFSDFPPALGIEFMSMSPDSLLPTPLFKRGTGS